LAVPAEPLTVFVVPDEAPASAEAMGTKRKFWFSRAAEMWLYKATRPGSGEHWAEVLAAALAEMLRLPHAEYELARWRDKSGVDNAGVVTRHFMPAGFDLVHGNELLAERDPSYPAAGHRYVRTQEHTIEAVRNALAVDVGLPLSWTPPQDIKTPGDVFGGYLLLDAWIANTDRHHENWALVVGLAEGHRYLAPTFDHASSLGAHQEDADRARRLESKDPRVRVEGYVEKARSALYSKAGEAKPMTPLDAFRAWCEHASCDPWLQRLETVEDGKVADFIGRVPDSEMSGPARAFAQAILQRNKWRILRAR
jgi:hypothetical protein